MIWENKELNEKRAYTEYKVTVPTTDFQIGFEFNEVDQNLHVRLNGIPVQDLGHTVTLVNSLTIRVEPPVQRGVVRLSRETDIDENKYKFTAGALFEARTMDEDFEQIRDAQQELRDEVNFLTSRWTLQDTILEVIASTSFPEPDMVFGAYTTARKFELHAYYPHVASCVSDIPISVGIYRNDAKVGTFTVSDEVSNDSKLVLDTTEEFITFNRGDRLLMKLETYHYTLNQISCTLVGKFPLYALL